MHGQKGGLLATVLPVVLKTEDYDVTEVVPGELSPEAVLETDAYVAHLPAQCPPWELLDEIYAALAVLRFGEWKGARKKVLLISSVSTWAKTEKEHLPILSVADGH